MSSLMSVDILAQLHQQPGWMMGVDEYMGLPLVEREYHFYYVSEVLEPLIQVVSVDDGVEGAKIVIPGRAVIFGNFPVNIGGGYDSPIEAVLDSKSRIFDFEPDPRTVQHIANATGMVPFTFVNPDHLSTYPLRSIWGGTTPAGLHPSRLGRML